MKYAHKAQFSYPKTFFLAPSTGQNVTTTTTGTLVFAVMQHHQAASMALDLLTHICVHRLSAHSDSKWHCWNKTDLGRRIK